MFDVIIPLGTGSRWNNNELRYALRSIEKHLKGYRDIYIIGECPNWLNKEKAIHIPAKDIAGRKEFSIFSKIMKAVEDPRVSQDFVFWNDDIFMLHDLDVKDFAIWYEGTIEEKYNQSHGHYKAAIGNVKSLLDEEGNPYADIHVPIIYNKYDFGLLKNFDWSKEYVIKSLYAAFNGHYIEPMSDLKINRPIEEAELKAKIKDRLFFSVGPYGISGGLTRVLRELFPNKSKYEL